MPIEVVSEANRREHWAKRYRRADRQKRDVWVELGVLCMAPSERRLRAKETATITLTRCGGKKMDSDNLSGAFKAVRDAIASWIQADDGDERLTWKYGQLPGKKDGIAVMIERS